MTNELKKLIQQASERENNDDHLTPDEKKNLCEMIRREENIDDEMTVADIYDAYVIE